MNALDRTWLRLTLVGAGAAAVLAIVVGVAAATGNDITGTVTLTGGQLSLASWPGQVAFPGATLTGLVQYVDDSNDGAFEVDDLTGSAAGWSITAKATAFTCSTGGCTGKSLGALETNGSNSSEGSTNAPSVACKVALTCDTGTTTVGKVTVPSASAATIFNQPAGHGMGDILVSNLNWWLTVPATAYAGAYSSTITLDVASGP